MKKLVTEDVAKANVDDMVRICLPRILCKAHTLIPLNEQPLAF